MGVPMPSARACSITLHPSISGSIRSSSPRGTQSGSNPAALRWWTIPWAMTLSSSTMRTFPILSEMVRKLEGEAASFEELRAGFTAVVSHELRTPLARLLALLETALLPDADSNTLVEQARQEVEQIRELVDDILFLSELETGREVVSLGATRALPILQEVVEDLSASAERAGVSISVEGDAELTVPIRPRMLRVVAENLAENAIRYSGDGTSFRFSLEQRDGAVFLVASDGGAGVPEEDLPRLFERFYRADRARTSRGTGLGLAIVKHIVTSAGGSVEADAPAGGGLEIRCVFP